MMWRTFIMGLAMACFLAGPGLTGVSAQMHEDNAWGFKIKVPRGWQKIPLKVDERWIIGKYMSDKSYVSEESYNHTPEMKIVVFPESVKKQRSRVEVKEDGESLEISLKYRYKDYRDYLKGNFTSGGYYFTQEEEGEIGGIKVSRYEIKVEKLTYSGKKRIIAWVFHLPDADVAVDFDVLENRYKKLKGLVYSTLKSFRLADRTAPHPESTDKNAEKKPTDKKKPKWEDMTAIERMKFRKEQADKILQQAIANLPDGWSHKKSAHFDALTHVDDRTTKKFLDQAEAIRAWLDKNFYEIGEDYVPRVILRICVDTAEENSYRKGSSDAWSSSNREIVISKKSSYDPREELKYLGGGICRQWLSDKNHTLGAYLPAWLQYGMPQYVGTAVVKGRKLQFKPDSWDRDVLRKGERENKLIQNQALIKMTWKDFTKAAQSNWGYLTLQSGSLVSYLMSSKCQRSTKTKGILVTYLRHVNDLAQELEKKRKAEREKATKPGDKEETEEEEEAARKREREGNEKDSRRLMDESFKRTFGDWTDKDWAAFERSWAKAAL